MMGLIADRQCTKCKKVLPATEFSKDRHRKDGLTSLCKPCRRKNYTRWTKENPEKYAARIEQDKARMASKYQSDPKGMSGYYYAHHKVRKERGPASKLTCSCGNQAEQWAYNHSDPNGLSTKFGYPYSTSPSFYEAMCRKCHSMFDYRRK